MAELGEVLEGVEAERDALQEQVDRLEAAAFQTSKQTRQDIQVLLHIGTIHCQSMTSMSVVGLCVAAAMARC